MTICPQPCENLLRVKQRSFQKELLGQIFQKITSYTLLYAFETTGWTLRTLSCLHTPHPMTSGYLIPMTTTQRDVFCVSSGIAFSCELGWRRRWQMSMKSTKLPLYLIGQ